MVIVRQEKPEDAVSVGCVNEQAFGRLSEGDLVDKLRRRGKITLSLVAVEDDRIIGHILFSPVTIQAEKSLFYGLALAPIAVLPEFQKRGIGSLLVKTGLEKCREAGYDWVVVLGDPGYYHRFGFVPASNYGFKCEFDVPDEVFMAIELRKGVFNGFSGTVRYQSEFNEL
ncbi:MAG: N-acetyltransferase [Candidatus Dadabacteria bacterium]|nr:N-acetyltransferase [Candidatus Dadabacteria bacterium]